MVRQDSQALQALLLRATQLYHVAPTQFALLAPPGTDPGELALRIHGELSRAGLGRDALFSTTCNVGLATILPGHTEPAEMLRQANTALDDARAKRSPIGIYLPAQDAAFRRAFTLLNDFASALTAPSPDDTMGYGLRLVFQPRLQLSTGRCVGVEALLRWTHPTLGEIPPAEFVRLVEKTTMARGLMHWVLDKALDQLVAWRRVGLRIQLSVNVSPANLEDDDFADHVLGALDAANLPPTALELEITESALLNETGPSLRQLRALSDMGICIAIDDFGTGYSSLSYLQRLPADVIKIDQSFVLGLSQGGADEHRLCTLIAAMIGLSHDLGYRVVAEGIETQEVADLLLSLKCDEVQGYWFAHPMAPAAFKAWYAQRAWIPTPRWNKAGVTHRIISA
jgi:EAL domain-containing protein (putative c-di-GMP-specific phosphodiesterase class I)